MAQGNIFQNTWNKFKNIWYVPTTPETTPDAEAPITQAYARNFGGSTDMDHNLNIFRAPIDIPRMKQDMNNWRLAISEAERQIFPYRYIMQQMYMDTMLEPYIVACWERRLNLTLQRKFRIKSRTSDDEYKEWTDFFNKSFFPIFVKYALEAKLYGYSLISLGEIVDNEFKNLVIVRRGNINPDTHLVTAVPRTIAGKNFKEEPYNNWMIWVNTPNDHAQSNTGYGLLYILTPLAIRLKNNLVYNADYNMKFGMPFRFMTTNDKNEVEKAKKERYLDNMGSSGWMIADKEDTLEFLQGNQGKGFAAFQDLEKRLQQQIAAVLLGHQDAIASTPGKLGSGQGGKGFGGSAQDQALDNIIASDGEFLRHIIESDLFRIIRYHGITSDGLELPEDACFEWNNDAEKVEHESMRNDENVKMVQILTGLKNNGYELDINAIEKLMDIQGLVKKEEQQPEPIQPNKPIQNFYNLSEKELRQSGHSKEEYEKQLEERKRLKEEQKINREYKEKTIGFDGKKRGLNKEQYKKYAEDIQKDLEEGKAIERAEGDAGNLHIGCRCHVENGKWIVHDDDRTCEECILAAELYNNADEADKMAIYDNHIK